MAEYLDRDDVLNVIDYIRTKYISVYNRKDKCSQFWGDTIRYFEKQINNLDGYDVVPVKHGHWIDNKHTDTAICSECKCVFTDETNYCPNCGSRMGGETI